MITQFLRSTGRWLLQRVRPPQAAQPSAPVRRRPRNVLTLTRWNASGEPPPALHWVPCHPATVARFKATVVCDRGHTLTLKQHVVDAQGAVWPSVVCPMQGCEFHRYVQLDCWEGPSGNANLDDRLRADIGGPFSANDRYWSRTAISH